ncbi:MAG: cobamide remodeling phosphodiesterase CbiR [Thermodesulfobacteriota bacterium]
MSLGLPAAPSYPWQLGTTSFVLPASLEENVRALAGQVDAVQLLFFESKHNSRLAHTVDVGLLAGLAEDHGLSYTVHLPLDIQLGSENKEIRQQGIEEICRLVEELEPLQAQAFDLHLNLEKDIEPAAWQENIHHSLENMALRIGGVQEKVGIENIGYDFELVAEVVQSCGFGICVDFGHRLRYNHQTDFDAISNWRHIHLHGADPGRDHRPFNSQDVDFLQRFGKTLVERSYRGVVTLELYELSGVCDSLATLHEAWQQFQQGEI